MQALASTDWPADISIDSDAGIVMDANTGVVLYGKNIHETYSPASITKVLTSLIVLEHCSLDETVTFSESAVYNVESNSSSAGYDTGDTASVKDCLYALLLKSANEAANALAEHVAGSADAFAVLMNEKAAELGCQDSHFANPSGLNNEEHYVSAYDMALITRAAFENPTFAKIVETTYYKLPPNQKNPEGQGISPGNKLVKKNWPQYYRPDVLGGKTGYTSIALNTLVNGARQGDTTLITVILHSNNTQYEDTSRLLDFGFNNFQSVKIADYDQTFSNIGKDLKIADVSTAGGESLSIDPDSRVVLPKTADFSETTTSFDYEIPAGAPDGTIACVTYSLGDHKVGQAYLTLTDSSQTAADIPEKLVSQAATATAQDSSDTALSDGSSEALPLSNPPESAANQENSSTGKSFGQLFHISVRVPPAFIAALTAILVVIGAVTAGIRFLQMQRRQEEDALAERRRRRAERLRDSGMSEADFDLMMQDRRTALAKKRKKRSHKIP
ncbi:MAG: D-alanyl-D-alanine carboxypeptidase family protein [Clostridium sp.]|nr:MULTISPECIES: D-alanyl-D-alanine carboxypeptidase family protein [Clostridium]MEE0130401.1 D-alanyl-D-alanine carboxypeptidase family protein [Clostridium sp.]